METGRRFGFLGFVFGNKVLTLLLGAALCFAARSPRPRLLLRRSRNGTWAPSRPLPAQQMEQQLLPCCRKCDLFFLSAAALQRSSNARKRFGCPNSPRRAWGSFQVGEIPLLGARTPFPTLPLQPRCLSPAPRSPFPPRLCSLCLSEPGRGEQQGPRAAACVVVAAHKAGSNPSPAPEEQPPPRPQAPLLLWGGVSIARSVPPRSASPLQPSPGLPNAGASQTRYF